MMTEHDLHRAYRSVAYEILSNDGHWDITWQSLQVWLHFHHMQPDLLYQLLERQVVLDLEHAPDSFVFVLPYWHVS